MPSTVSTESACTSMCTRCLTVLGSGTGHSAMPMPSTSPMTSPATYWHPVAPAQNSPITATSPCTSRHSSLKRVMAFLPFIFVTGCPGSLTCMSQQTPDLPLPQNSRAWGHGLATIAEDGTVLDTWYPAPQLGDSTGEPAPEALATLAQKYAERRVHTDVVTVAIGLSEPPADASDVYLRLHLLSHRLVRPHQVDLDGIFGKLTNVVWTNHGPCAVAGFEEVRLALRALGPVQVFGVDKFPRMTDYVLPSGVRIADADRVRLGAHLAEGTTVMHEGFVNYNAGTLGSSMVEGRISAGVVVGDGSDIGGGASIMGTLSGGGKDIISVGTGSPIGAKRGLRISLGDEGVVRPMGPPVPPQLHDGRGRGPAARRDVVGRAERGAARELGARRPEEPA